MRLVLVTLFGMMLGINIKQKNESIRIAQNKTVLLDPVELISQSDADSSIQVSLQTSCDFQEELFTFSSGFEGFCQQNQVTKSLGEMQSLLKGLAVTQAKESKKELFVLKYQLSYKESDQEKLFNF